MEGQHHRVTKTVIDKITLSHRETIRPHDDLMLLTTNLPALFPLFLKLVRIDHRTALLRPFAERIRLTSFYFMGFAWRLPASISDCRRKSPGEAGHFCSDFC